MKPPELFAVAVRVAGLVSLLYLIATSVMFFGVGLPWALVVKSILWLLLSLWLLRGAPQLVRFAYPRPE
jgi:hypothetical protein